MALIKCDECGHDVSTKAKSYPNCGAPVESFQPKDHVYKQKWSGGYRSSEYAFVDIIPE